MKAKALVAGHALHAQLIVFPLGLLGISPLWDILRLTTDGTMWGVVGFWTIVAGAVSALVAAVPGLIDYTKIPRGTRARGVATLHMILNLVVVALFVLSLWLRARTTGGYDQAGTLAMLPGWIAVGLAVVSGWLGGELVETLGIGVHEGAHPNAPSSLTGTGGTRAPQPRPAGSPA
jgi:uncharacterized membrane protein